MFDCHLHTEFSTDSAMKIEDAILRAQNLNMGIIVTEHMDLNYPNPQLFIFNPDEYLKKFSKYRSDKVLLGIELGMTEEYAIKNKEIERKYPFDYVLGSLHFVGEIDIFDKILYKDRKKEEVYEAYFKNMLRCLKIHTFIDALAHIDYISRYATYENKEIEYPAFAEYIDPVLNEIAFQEKAIEINTRRLGDPKAIENMLRIYKRFYELGGRYVVLGSDSHNVDSIAKHFSFAEKIAEEAQLKTVYFKERRMEYI